MPSFRIVYVRHDTTKPETITAGFDSLEQAMDVFAVRRLSIIYIAEQSCDTRRLCNVVSTASRGAEAKSPTRSSFPVHRFSARVLA